MAADRTLKDGSRINDNEALIESSFRRLLASIESEREKLRSTWGDLEEEQGGVQDNLARLRADTEEYCEMERQKIDSDWKRLDHLRERFSVLWPEDAQLLELNVSGVLMSLPKNALTSIQGSYLNHMFSDAFIEQVPLDSQKRFFLDFNPICFGVIVDYLKDRRTRHDAPIPEVPPEEQQNMDVLIEALKLKPFMLKNSISKAVRTSLEIKGNVIEATMTGWQVVAAERPLSMAGPTYFELRVLTNPDAKGGLAVGLCAHKPTGSEIHNIRLKNSVMYCSGSGLSGDCYCAENVPKGIHLGDGQSIGIRHDPTSHTLEWYHNRLKVGACAFRPEIMHNLGQMYPVFACYVPGQKIEADFEIGSPQVSMGQGGGTNQKFHW